MQLKWISVLALLAISSIQWGLSAGEELAEKASNNRPQRRTYYYYYSYYSYYTYYYSSYDVSAWAYILIFAVISLFVCCLPCIIIGFTACIALCVTAVTSTSSCSTRNNVTTMPEWPDPTMPFYTYPQPVQTHGYYPPGPPDVVLAPYDAPPPSYQTTQQDNPQSNIGFQI